MVIRIVQFDKMVYTIGCVRRSELKDFVTRFTFVIYTMGSRSGTSSPRNIVVVVVVVGVVVVVVGVANVPLFETFDDWMI